MSTGPVVPEHLRKALVRELRSREEFQNDKGEINQTRVAKASGLTQGAIWRLLETGRGGQEVVSGVLKAIGATSVDALHDLAEKADLYPPIEGDVDSRASDFLTWVHSAEVQRWIAAHEEITIGDLLRYRRKGQSSAGQYDADTVWSMMRMLRRRGEVPEGIELPIHDETKVGPTTGRLRRPKNGASMKR